MGSRLTASGTEKVYWDKFIRHASEYLDSGRLDTEEIKYKVEISRKLAGARREVFAGAPEWADSLKTALKDANFVWHGRRTELREWCANDPGAALRALQAIWTEDDSSVFDRIRAFSDRFPRSVTSGAGSRMNVASGLLMELDVYKYPPFLIRKFEAAYERTGYEQADQNADEAALYQHALGFLDRFIEEASNRGLKLRHRLDAQSVVWAVLEHLNERQAGTEKPPDHNGRHARHDLWDEFVRRAQAYVDSGKLETEEIEYKVEAGRNLDAVRQPVLDNASNWPEKLKRALEPIKGNPIHWQGVDNLNKWCAGDSVKALGALRAIWTQDRLSVFERIRAFSERLPTGVISGVGSRMNVASGLLMGLDVYKYPPFQVTKFEEAYTLTGYEQPEVEADEAAQYEHALAFLDRFIEEASKRGLKLRDRLDAQSVVWGVLQNRNGPPDEMWSPARVESLSKELLWQTSDLQKIIDGLQDKRQAIFQGPPGTGKTYVAKRIAEHCRDHGGDFKIVQFHPSYSYEDFVEGFRPTLTDGGQAAFKLTPGPLRLIAEEAAAKPDATFILVIDEINRGNVAKVLGELYFLLEYRGDMVNLQYSNNEFSLPTNLWFIGTMNTTDRSIALVDAALRRRFYFFGFFPDEPPIKGLLRRWLEKNNSELGWVAKLVDQANGELGDRHMGIGPSHFMKNEPPLDEKRVRFIWEQAVIPYIEEQSFGDEARLKDFAYDRLRQKPEGDGQTEAGDGDAPD